LFDDGRAPKVFKKDNLVVERKQVDELLNKEIRILSRNLRVMAAGPLSLLKKQKNEQKEQIEEDLIEATDEDDEKPT